MKFVRIILLFLLIFSPLVARSEEGISLIRDAEIEKALRDYGTPIWNAAGINPESVNIFIVNDPSLNAFTSGGLNLFVNTGLIIRAEKANMLVGVIAHETGHIIGGHVVKRINQAEGLSNEMLISAILGAAVSVAGLPDAGMAIIAGGQHLAERGFLSFSREQEVVADQVGLNLLKKSGQTSGGLLNLMEILRRDQTLNFDKPDPYAVTHPLSQERVSHIRSEEMNEPEFPPDNFDIQHHRIVAKLEAFLQKPELTLQKYTDNSIPAIYARAIAYYKIPNLNKSLTEMDKLLKREPNDPFFNELKGQILAENDRIAEAEKYYQRADDLYPNSAQIKYDYGRMQLANGKIASSIITLTQSAKLEPSGITWRTLANAYGKLGNQGMFKLAQAEEASLLAKNDDAKKYAEEAAKLLPKNSPASLRAQDIINQVKLRKDKN